MAKKELMTVASDAQLAELSADFPMEASYTRMMLPRFGMASQDRTEEEGTGRNKTIKIVAAAGTFFIEKESEDTVTREDGTEGKVWNTDYLDEENPEIIILFQRKQLRYYDEEDKKYTSSPVFDSNNETVVLFRDRKEFARGTVEELKAMFPGKDKKGKDISLLKDEKILYVLVNGDLHQLNLHGSSMWAFTKYAGKVVPPSVVTILGSEAKENGAVAWNQMTFTAKRKLTSEEAEMAIAKLSEIKRAIAGEKEFFAGKSAAKDELTAGQKALMGEEEVF